jgi:hypothetical protein
MSVIPLVLITAIVGTLALGASGRHSVADLASGQRESSPPCRISGESVAVPDLREGSGVAASRARPGVLWAHNDSAHPVLVALSEQGAVLGRVRVIGAQVDDWEDIAVGPCAHGSCVYIGDIGDNNGSRTHVTVYRVPEPSAGETSTRPAEVFHAKYADGAHDAESLFVTGSSDLFLITKGDPGPIALYRFPRPLSTGATMQLERVGQPATSRPEAKDRPTAAAISPDGRWVGVRTTHYISFYPAKDFTAGRWREASRMDLSSLGEPRGEGLTFGRDGSVFLVGEGGTGGRSGTFSRLSCTLPR